MIHRSTMNNSSQQPRFPSIPCVKRTRKSFLRTFCSFSYHVISTFWLLRSEHLLLSFPYLFQKHIAETPTNCCLQSFPCLFDPKHVRTSSHFCRIPLFSQSNLDCLCIISILRNFGSHLSKSH